MLNINNSKDIPKMMMYHRTKDMINLLNLFPKLSPIKDLTVIESIEDYIENYDYCSKLKCIRNDTLISKQDIISIEGQNVVDIFKKVKEIDKDGVLILFNLNHKSSARYERHAGISVGISLGKSIYIDAVGKGFDGREVSKGISTHERYIIPWFELRKLNINNFKNYRTYLISDKEYSKSREERINFLISTGLYKDEVEKNIPKKYKEIPDFIWLDIIKELLKKLEKMEEELLQYGFTDFAISGHTEGEKFLPWQLFDKSRYTGLRGEHDLYK